MLSYGPAFRPSLPTAAAGVPDVPETGSLD